ncbi:hypothetical protein TA3x_003807 [Tundrisphaera sp. TA3]|uniref:hypothetical protein n=1 Tax=Tundrisphaera sp. TA3 TaxID=3435775 RepID=UPI003EBE50D2
MPGISAADAGPTPWIAPAGPDIRRDRDASKGPAARRGVFTDGVGVITATFHAEDAGGMDPWAAAKA